MAIGNGPSVNNDLVKALLLAKADCNLALDKNASQWRGLATPLRQAWEEEEEESV